MDAISVDITSDTVCPWCFVGKRRLEQAITNLGMAGRVEVRWHPFQLDPRVPQAGVPMRQYLSAKFGPEHRWQPMIDRLTGLGPEAGIAFDWDRIDVRPNSIDSHRVIRWAAEEGYRTQNAVVEAIMAGYWERGEDIGSAAVLARLAGVGGMDSASVARRLASGEDREEVLQASREAVGREVTGVPDVVIGRRFRVVGAQPAAYFERAFRMLEPT